MDMKDIDWVDNVIARSDLYNKAIKSMRIFDRENSEIFGVKY